MKKIDGASPGLNATKEVRETEQSFRKNEYLTSSGRYNFETIETSVREALDLVDTKLVF